MKQQIITIDGPAGAGKSTISRILAKKMGFFYLDTGAMYRAVALQAKRKNIDFSDGEGLKTLCCDLDLRFVTDNDNSKIYIGGDDITDAIRVPEMDMLASSVSAVKEVRESMTTLQQKMGKNGGLVAEGRDMGTVVFPDAGFKFFITATVEERAQRRYKERIEKKESVLLKEVESELRKRDEQDTMRSIAPLRPADDANIVDTSMMNIDQVIDEIVLKIEKIGNID
jgi:CMP/dCMP kinase